MNLYLLLRHEYTVNGISRKVYVFAKSFLHDMLGGSIEAAEEKNIGVG